MNLVIGNKNYSSWSLRPWLLLKANKIPFNEVNESLQKEGIHERLGKYSGACKVPVLIDDGITIWDSLAICEYISDVYLNNEGWPSDQHDKALARSICAEMHAGFGAVRSELPMNCRLTKNVTLSDAVRAEVQRIDTIWSQYAKEDNDGNSHLFGKFGIADCFFAPVALRFKTYGVPLTERATAYQKCLLSNPSLRLWVAQACEETEVVPGNEI